MAKKRVLIIGGGVSGCTAAYWLSKQKNIASVSLHTMGWKLGGKGASGRNEKHEWRSEEHGPHAWAGWYHNAIHTCRAAYDDFLKKHHSHGPFTHAMDDGPNVKGAAFRRISESAFFPNHHSAKPTPWVLRFPKNGKLKDGVSHLQEVGLSSVISRGMALLKANSPFFFFLPTNVPLPPLKPKSRVWLKLIRLMVKALQKLNRVNLACRSGDGLKMPLFYDYGLALLDALVIEIWKPASERFDGLNGIDFQELLRKHGAQFPGVEDSPYIRSLYDAAFAYPDGTDDAPSLEAGTALRTAAAIFFSGGAYIYKMQAGMGELVFSPLYEVTKTRVDYHFFHELTEINLTPDGKKVASLVFAEQAKVKDHYAPLIKVPAAKDMLCWPAEPYWDQLDPEDRARVADSRDFERPGRTGGIHPDITLEVGKDFDEIIFALPPAALAKVGGNLVRERPEFITLDERLPSVASVNFQAWMKGKESGRLWEKRLGLEEPMGASAGPGELDVILDYSPVLSTEATPPEVNHLIYFTGTVPDGERIGHEELSQEWLRKYGGDAFPELADEQGNFDFSVLHSQQYSRYNDEGSERYVVASAGSWQHRPTTDGTGIENFHLAGDWTKNGIDIGSVEAATVSGMLAVEKLAKVDLQIRFPLDSI